MANAKFWDKIAPKYFKDKISDMKAYEEGLSRIEGYLGSDMRVIELGCGTGMTAARLAKSAGSYLGTDISPKMIEIAKENYQADNLHFDVLSMQGDWARANEYDAVIALNLLHLLDDLNGELAQIHATLRKGGIFVSKTACLREWGWYMAPIIRVMQFFGKAPNSVLNFSIKELDNAIERAGFEIIEQGPMKSQKSPRFLVARKI